VLYIGVMAKAPLSVTIFVWLIFALANAQEAAPSLEFHDLKGAPHKLEDYRGKPVLLNFWATWCVPCAAEMPLLSEMQKRYQGRVLFIAASIDDDDMKPQIEAFIKKHQGDTLTVMMGATLDSLEDFGVNQGMPGTVFIDADGNIVGRLSGALKRTDLQKRLRKLTGEPEPTSTPQTVKKKASKSSRKKLVPAAQESSRHAF
jgi:cytochrome c biogenesis protein CcmG/thiol:disulfide interchange protein DsbE